MRSFALILAAGWLSRDIPLSHLKDVLALAALGCVALLSFRWPNTNPSLKETFEGRLREAKLQFLQFLDGLSVGVFVITHDRQVMIANTWGKDVLKCDSLLEVADALAATEYVENRRLYFNNGHENHSNHINHSSHKGRRGSLGQDISHFLDCSSQASALFGMTSDSNRTFSWQGRRSQWEGKPAILIEVYDATVSIELECSKTESNCKSIMLRSVSHELRSPIAGVMYAIEAVEEIQELPEWAKLRLGISKVCCKHLLALVNDLLDYSQIIAGKFTLVRSYFNLGKTLSNAFELMRYVAEKKRLQFVMHIDPLLPEMVNSDPNRLSQIVINLLSNAVKFTPQYGRVDLSALLDDDGMLEISVKDTGIGIRESSVSSLFKLFGRLEETASINSQGIGLGLYISNLLAIELGSNIKVESKLNEGSCFKFKVKFSETIQFHPVFSSSYTELDCEENSPMNKVYSFSMKSLECPQVLVVDDSAFSRSVIIEILASMDISCVELNSGVEALNYIQEKAKHKLLVKVILMDVEMPELDGPASARAIIQSLGKQNLPIPSVIAHSGNVDEDTMRKCLEAGMVSYLQKPSSKDDILSTVRRYL